MGDDDDVDISPGFSDSTTEDGVRSKRKYLTEVLLDDPIDVSALSLTEFPRYELLEEKFRNALRPVEEGCDDSHNETEVGEFLQAEWDDPLIGQFEELLTKNLFAALRSAIKKIIECGYDEDTAKKIILKSGLFHGDKDVVSNIVDGALASSKSENVSDATRRNAFENLESLVEYTMLEMICALREVKPSFTVAEAMWWLLICDLNVSLACSLDHLDGVHGQGTLARKFTDSTNRQSTLDDAESSYPIPNAKNTIKSLNPCAQSQSECLKVGPAPQLSNSKCMHVCEVGKATKVQVPFPQTAVRSSGKNVKQVQALSQTLVGEDKLAGGRKGFSVNVKRDMLRQKTFHFEKSYRGRMSKGHFKAKFSAWSNMVLDKPQKSPSGASGILMKSSYSKITTSVEASGSVSEQIHHQTNDTSSILSAFDPPGTVKDASLAPPAANCKIPAPACPEARTTSIAKFNNPGTSETSDYYTGIPYDKTMKKYVSRDEKEETILMIVPLMQALKKEIESWTDWANVKVMEAAARLNKDQVELKALRQEKEEAEKFQKDKQALEESTAKRLVEMEQAYTNNTALVEAANSALHSLAAKNSMLRRGLEAAKLQALRSAARLQKAVHREQEVLKNSQSWDLEKGLMQEEVTALKRNSADLERKLDKVKGRLKQLEGLGKKEEKEKQEALLKAKSIRVRREQLEALGEAEEVDIGRKSDSNIQKLREEIKRLESEVSVLRFERESMRIGALRTGTGMDLMGSKSTPTHPGVHSPSADRRLPVLVAKDEKRERECVVCWAEEKSVLLLPCAHLVLCAECNVQHEQGMNECPSCRTPIQRRIHVQKRTSF